jgi:hypothetical protein
MKKTEFSILLVSTRPRPVIRVEDCIIVKASFCHDGELAVTLTRISHNDTGTYRSTVACIIPKIECLK